MSLIGPNFSLCVKESEKCVADGASMLGILSQYNATNASAFVHLPTKR